MASPKALSRIVRFNAVKEMIDSKGTIENLTPLALNFSFYDSSHIAAEFKHFSGLSPTSYLKQNRQ